MFVLENHYSNFNTCFLGIVAMFAVNDTIWTMDNKKLLSMGYDYMQLSIKLPENPYINVIILPPYQASAIIIGMCY